MATIFNLLPEVHEDETTLNAVLNIIAKNGGQVASVTHQCDDVIVVYALDDDELAMLISDDSHEIFGIVTLDEQGIVLHKAEGYSWPSIMTMHNNELTDLIGYYTNNSAE